MKIRHGILDQQPFIKGQTVGAYNDPPVALPLYARILATSNLVTATVQTIVNLWQSFGVERHVEPFFQA